MIEFNLFRDDLESGLNHQSFEVQANNIDDEALSFSNDKIQCYLSSEKQWHGFLLKGEISFSFLVLCDRCVSKYEDKQNSSFEIVLTDNNDLEKLIDIGPIIRDQILMTEPIKKVCHSDCKGLCQHCGQNQNENSCNCDNKQPVDDVWENLKQFV